MPDLRYDELEDRARRLLQSADGATVPPTPFDPAPAMAGGRRRIYRRRAATAAGLVLVLFGLALATRPALGPLRVLQPARHSVPTAASTPLSASAELFFSDVEHVEFLLGPTPENTARLELHRQHAYAACMQTSGFQYELPTNAVSPPARHYEPSWWQRPSLHEAEKGLGYASLPEPVGTPTSNDPHSFATKGSYDEALNVCTHAVDLRPEFSDPPNPKAQALLTSLTDTLWSSANSLTGFTPIQRRYSTCMKSAGIDVREPGGLYDIAEAKVSRVINGVDPYSDAYRALLPRAQAIEVRIDKVDVMCRAPLADDIARLLGPKLDDWSARNNEQMQQAAKGW